MLNVTAIASLGMSQINVKLSNLITVYSKAIITIIVRKAIKRSNIRS